MQSIDEIRTERLILSRIRHLDLGNVTALYGDPDVMALVGGTWTAQQTESLVEWFIEHWASHGFGPWIAREATSNHFVGLIGLLQVRIQGIDEVHPGYVLMRKFWGRGLATESLRAIVDISFSVLNLPSLAGFTAPTNVSARRPFEKAGFSFERNFTDEKGAPQALYRLTQTRWRDLAGIMSSF